jgi:hypothetical protein
MEMLQVALSEVSVETCARPERRRRPLDFNRSGKIATVPNRGGMEDVPAVDPPYASRGGKESEDAEMKEERKKEEGRDGRWRL